VEQRATFKFFRSFFEAATLLTDREGNPDKAAQADFLLAICDYALNGTVPELKGTAGALFLLVKPNLDTSIKRSESGATGGKNSKQTESKSQANDNQTVSKPEANSKQTVSKSQPEEGSRKKEVGSKDVGGKPPKAPQGGSTGFERFWAAYPKKVGKEAAKKAFSKVKVPVESLLAAIERQKCSDQWSKDNGQFIPNPTTWLNQGRWEDELPSSSSSVQATGTFAPGDFERQSAERLRRIRDSLKGDES
jgi:hypothetical protein